MSHLRYKTITHKQAVCSLYKSCIRNIEAFYYHREEQRYQSILMRARFDANKNVTDPREAKTLYLKGVEELDYQTHPQPLRFPKCPGGSAHDRYHNNPDWMMDAWHPYEKAQYPTYFATREKRKQEYIENYERQKAQWENGKESEH